MNTIEKYNEYGKELFDTLLLRFEPIAIKLLYSRNEIPEGCYVPSRDGGKLPALCQAYALVRRNRKSIAMFRDDHWCIWPVVALKQGEMDEELYEDLGCRFFLKDPEVSRKRFRTKFPVLKSDRPVEGLAMAPLSTCNFEPDVVVIYSTPSQVRQLMMGAQYATGEPVKAEFDIVGSCIQAIVPVLNGEKDYNLSLPDDGEYERSLVLEDEMLFTVSKKKLDELMESMRAIRAIGFGHKSLAMDMNLEYPRPDFYNNAMKKWGLKTGELWDYNR